MHTQHGTIYYIWKPYGLMEIYMESPYDIPYGPVWPYGNHMFGTIA